jgi:hypothetical protein
MLQSVNFLDSYGGGLLSTQGIQTTSLPPLSLPTSTGSNGGVMGGLDPLSIGLSGLNVLDGVLGAGLMDNISNVLTYGLSSWGASTDPASAQKFFQGTIRPAVSSLLTDLNADNLEENLKQVSKILEHGIALYKHKLAKHFKAGSSKEAAKQNIQMYSDLKSETLNKVVSQLKSANVIVKTVQATATDSELKGMLAGGDDPNLHEDGPLKYDYWIIDVEKLYKVQSSSQTIEEGQTLGDNDQKPQQAGSGALIGIGIAFALAKIFKLF